MYFLYVFLDCILCIVCILCISGLYFILFLDCLFMYFLDIGHDRLVVVKMRLVVTNTSMIRSMIRIRA